jgi:hypothetical protein
MAKNPIYSGTMEIYGTDYGATILNQIRFKFSGEPGTDNDTELPKVLGGQMCFTPSSDATSKCLPRRSPIEPRHFIVTFPVAVHKMNVADPGEIRDCGRTLAALPNVKCIGYKGESVRNLQLLVSP